MLTGFHSPAKDLRYAAANHINRQCSTIKYIAICEFQYLQMYLGLS